MKNMKELEDDLSTALANLLTVGVSGPAVVPMGRAIEAVNAALERVRNANRERKDASMEEPRGTEASE